MVNWIIFYFSEHLFDYMLEKEQTRPQHWEAYVTGGDIATSEDDDNPDDPPVNSESKCDSLNQIYKSISKNLWHIYILT